MFYPRKILNHLHRQKNKREIIVLTGMRRTGKTTVLKMLFEEIESRNKVFFDLENPLEQKIFEETDYNNIWANLKPYNISSKEKTYIFLDEIQSMPNIVKVVKYLFDHYNVKFFLTGSSSFYLKNLFPESLAGRKLVFEIYPLDFEEFLTFKNTKKEFYNSLSESDKEKNMIVYEKVKKLYEEYLIYGGFPQVALEENFTQKEFILSDIFKSYFEKDVRILSDFRDINAFRDLLILLTQRVGTKLDISKLASEVGVSRETVYSYISFLQGTYFVTLISPFTTNVDREISKSKKLYLCDTGIIHHIAKVDEGRLFENSVFNNLRKYGNVHYYEKRLGGEIDFILNKEIGIEVKTRGTLQELRWLRKMANLLHLTDSYIITKHFTKDVGFIPVTEI